MYVKNKIPDLMKGIYFTCPLPSGIFQTLPYCYEVFKANSTQNISPTNTTLVRGLSILYQDIDFQPNLKYLRDLNIDVCFRASLTNIQKNKIPYHTVRDFFWSTFQVLVLKGGFRLKRADDCHLCFSLSSGLARLSICEVTILALLTSLYGELLKPNTANIQKTFLQKLLQVKNICGRFVL